VTGFNQMLAELFASVQAQVLPNGQQLYIGTRRQTPAGSPIQWQTPALQRALSWQRLPQVPQWASSLAVSTQTPSQHWTAGLAPQFVPLA
jgi:hypothetical protein